MVHHDKTNWPISVSIDIPVPAEEVWKQMVTPGNAVLWHPFVKEHKAENWSGVGAKDRVIYNSGAAFDREVIEWTEGIGFDLRKEGQVCR
jgi:hypothetical protein